MEREEFFQEILEKYKGPLTLGLLGLILLGLGILASHFRTQREEGIEIISDQEKEAEEIFVDLQGAVKKPGVYQLAFGSRLNDLLIAAGGLGEKADRDWVAKNLNLAQELTDGAKIYIPKIGEMGDRSLGSLGGIGGVVDINTASQRELESLPGIGPKTAQKIIQNRPYQKTEDLLKVSGIGPKTLEKLEDQITIY